MIGNKKLKIQVYGMDKDGKYRYVFGKNTNHLTAKQLQNLIKEYDK